MRDEGCDVDKLFAGEVPAALRLDLVFDMEGGAGAVIGGEGPGDHVGTTCLKWSLYGFDAKMRQL